MVVHMILVHGVGVRLPGPEPTFPLYRWDSKVIADKFVAYNFYSRHITDSFLENAA